MVIKIVRTRVQNNHNCQIRYITISILPLRLASPELRSFTIGDVKYLPATDTVDVVLELPLPQLDVLLAQMAVG